MSLGSTPYGYGKQHDVYGVQTFLLPVVQTEAGDNDKNVWKAQGAPFKFRVFRAYGVMTGVGQVGDTVQLKDGDGNAITEAVDLSALSDKDAFDFSSFDDAYWDIDKGGNIEVETASDALCKVFIEVYKVA
jgi:hypothetical protein